MFSKLHKIEIAIAMMVLMVHVLASTSQDSVVCQV